MSDTSQCRFSSRIFVTDGDPDKLRLVVEKAIQQQMEQFAAITF